MAREGPGAGRGRLLRVRRRSGGVRARPGQTRRLTLAVCFVALFTLVAGLLAIWAHERPMFAPGRIATVTRMARVELSVIDQTTTESMRQEQRLRAARVYVSNEAELSAIRASLTNLPRTIAGVDSLDQVESTIRTKFELNEERFAALRELGGQAEGLARWDLSVDRLMQILTVTPLLDQEAWQVESQSGLRGEKWLELRTSGGIARVSADAAVSISNVDGLNRAMGDAVGRAGFDSAAAGAVLSALVHDPGSTFRFDEPATLENQQRAADAVSDQYRRVPEGTLLFRRGNPIKPEAFELYKAELEAFRAQATWWMIWPLRFGLFGAMLVIACAAACYISLFCDRIARSPARMGWLTGLSLLMLLMATAATVSNPGVMMLSGTAPSVLFAVLIAIAYHQRIGLALGLVQALVTGVALDQHMEILAVVGAGVGVAAWNLPRIRDRGTLVRMGVASAAALALATALVGAIHRPMNPALIREIGVDALLAGSGGLLVAGLTMFILPVLERAFDITTGMTLMELRDPKQPLLRELQQRAPGTYNHSLNVAAIAEDAADAIGADSLLAYVGALYHDVGKMNKPEYFVENQAGGPSKHDKLSPAMSLLVIVGHVKDGVELAREFGLPRKLRHFIEAHHGTTLVEFFFHRAKDKANPGEGPNEFEYRYPGPKPQTKEVAILMLADAVESTTRSLKEPTSSRIDQVVRSIANKRLLDGQFDECSLTLRELSTIVEAISRTVQSIHHGRIAYPSAEPKSGSIRPTRDDRRTG
ncbi:MAG: HDIG domain-containing protein [Phycisphaeraceae bacterium]|nr:HDIG domain-containing protein [Phycisphaeraceae bacterium]